MSCSEYFDTYRFCLNEDEKQEVRCVLYQWLFKSLDQIDPRRKEISEMLEKQLCNIFGINWFSYSELEELSTLLEVNLSNKDRELLYGKRFKFY